MTPEAISLLRILTGGIILTLFVGFCGVLLTRNLLRTLIAIEVLMKSVTLALIVAGYFTTRSGQAQAMAITLIVLEVAVVVVAVGVILGIYRNTRSLDAASLENPEQI